jgi:hypothetical protein
MPTLTAEQLWYLWYGRDWREDSEKFRLPPDPEPEFEEEEDFFLDWPKILSEDGFNDTETE